MLGLMFILAVCGAEDIATKNVPVEKAPTASVTQSAKPAPKEIAVASYERDAQAPTENISSNVSENVSGNVSENVAENTSGNVSENVLADRSPEEDILDSLFGTVTPELVSIAIAALPERTEFFTGQTLNISGLVIVGYYSDETTASIDVSLADISGYTEAQVGTQSITVVVNSINATFEVAVQDPQPVALEVVQLPDKRHYLRGEALDTEGLVVSKCYNDGSSQIETTLNISGYVAEQLGEQTITVLSEDSCTTDFTVTVYDIVTEALASDMWKSYSQINADKIYLLDTLNCDRMEIYDLVSGRIRNLSLPRMKGRTYQIHENKLYMPEYTMGSTLYVYDLETGQQEIKNLPTTMERRATQLYEGKLYMPQWRSTSSGAVLEIYDIATETTVTRNLPCKAMERGVAQIYDGKLYLPENGGRRLEIYDMATGRTTVRTLPHNMQRYTAQIHNGKLYMPDGEINYNGATLEIYDIAAGTTETKILPSAMYRQTAQIYKDRLYLPEHGGTKMEIYDIANDTIEVVSLAHDMYRSTAHLYDGKLYLPESGGARLEILALE
jgi:hypothetical protein